MAAPRVAKMADRMAGCSVALRVAPSVDNLARRRVVHWAEYSVVSTVGRLAECLVGAKVACSVASMAAAMVANLVVLRVADSVA